MRNFGPLAGLALATFTLQGCAAALIPVAAAGVIGKKQIDRGRERARAAEASLEDKTAESIVTPVDSAANNVPDVVELPSLETDTAAPEELPAEQTQTTLDRLNTSGITNAYLPFARYAIQAAIKRNSGASIASAVLVDKVSLSNPATISCEGKPLLAILDLDIAPGTPAELEVEKQSGFATILDAVRDSGIRIAWLADASETELQPVLDLLKSDDDPVMDGDDLQLFGHSSGYRKQERRWQLARDHCVVAIAGDQRADFDELYQYLKDQDYAIRLEAYIGRRWFELPHPVAAIDSERLQAEPKTPEVESTR